MCTAWKQKQSTRDSIYSHKFRLANSRETLDAREKLNSRQIRTSRQLVEYTYYTIYALCEFECVNDEQAEREKKSPKQ